MKEIKPQPVNVGENEILLKDRDRWLHFARPYRVLAVTELRQVLPALREVERLVQENGWHAAGFLSYEAAPAFDPALKTRPALTWTDERSGLQDEFPYLWFGLYPEPSAATLPAPGKPRGSLAWLPTVDRPTYQDAVEKVKGYIADGRTYQVNYTMRLQAAFPGEAWDFFVRLVEGQNNYAAYVDTGRYVICSASPELFFELSGDTITCRPMKGTTQRGRTTQEDLERAAWLTGSVKDRAENVMIVDMIRNDLGRIADVGTVSVPALFETERYPTLWQLTSTVAARTSASLAEIFSALFPCASITGAPKVSTMQIIAELEQTPRRIYTGSIGYIAPGRRAKFNVAIRTAIVDRADRSVEYGTGGGIVWDSTGPAEYAEALLKARLLTTEPTSFSLLETLLWTPDTGFALYDRHLERMLDSARYFDFAITREKLEKYLDDVSSGFSMPQRVRLLLDHDGQLAAEAFPFERSRDTAPLRTCLAREAVDSTDIFLYHKTTQRAVYESAREGCREFDDVLLYNERGELTEFTIGNLVVELDGQLWTPPITCGVLAGTLRAHLLATGQIFERTIPATEIPRCTKMFRINSVRGWEQVEIKRIL